MSASKAETVRLSLPSTKDSFTLTKVKELSIQLANDIRSAYRTLAKDEMFLCVFSVHLHWIMYEGMKNAFEHGNKWNPAKKTTVNCSLYRDLVDLSILDQGEQEIDLTPKKNRITDSNIPEAAFSGGGKGVEQIRCLAENAFKGKARWIPSYDAQGRKIGTELRVVVPTFWFMREWPDLASSGLK